LKDIIGTARVLAKSNLFSEDVMEAFVPSGMSIREIIGNEFDNYAVTLNSDIISADNWATTFVDTFDVLTIVKVPAGDDENALKRFILVIVVLIIAYYAGPAAAEVIGGTAEFWTSAIAFVGTVVINLVLPPLMPDVTDGASKRLNSLTGTRNSFAPFEPIPILYGKHRLYPPIAAFPYTEVIGTDQYLHMLYCVGLGTYAIDSTTMKIGDTPASEFEGVDIEITDQPLQPDIFELQQALVFNQDATPGDEFTRTTAADTDTIGVDFVFPGGLVKIDQEDGEEKHVQIHFSVDFRISGSADPWVSVNTLDWEEDTNGRLLIVGGLNNITTTGNPPIKSSSYGSLRVSGVNSDWIAVTSRSRDPLRSGFTFSPATRDTWDIRIIRQQTNIMGGAAVTSLDDIWIEIASSVAWTALRSTKYEVGVSIGPNIATFIKVRIRATDQLNGIIDSFNLIAEKELRTWDKTGQTFTAPAATRDPAWAYLDILTGLGNARPITNESKYIWLDELSDWATANASGGRFYDEVVDYRTSVFSALTIACGVGRASLSTRDGKWTVVLEQASPTPVQFFTPRNSWNFSSVKRFVNFPHAFKIRFNAEDSDYQEDEVIVYDDGFNVGNAVDFEVIQLQGITDSDQAWRTGKYTLAALRLRPEIYTFNSDIEHIVAQRGDHVLASHDIPLWGNSYGRIKDISGNVVTTDESVDLDGGTTYVMRIRLDDGTSVIENLTLQGGTDISSHTFTPSIPTGVQIGDLYMIGEVGSETQELVIISVEPTKDLSARITCVDHDPAILTADDGTPPVFSPNITLPIDPTQLRPAPPFNITANSDQIVHTVDGAGTLNPRIAVSWDLPSNSSERWPALRAEIRWREYDVTVNSGDAGTWVVIFIQNSFQGFGIVEDINVGVEYEIQVRSTTEYDIPSLWSGAILHTVGGATRLPPAVDSVVTSDEFGGVEVDVDFTSLITRTGSYLEIAYGTVNDRNDGGTVIRPFPIPRNLTDITTLKFFLPFTNTTARYFWARLVDIYGSQSTWIPSSATAGILGTPKQAVATFYYIKAIAGTAIKNGSGQLTVEAHKVDGASDILLSSGTIQLFDPGNNIVNVANGYVTGSDGYTGILDSGDITSEIVITLKDGAGGTVLDTITLVDIDDGADSVYGYIEAVSTLAWVRGPNNGAWEPLATSTNLDVTIVKGGTDQARWSRQIDRASDGLLTDGGATNHVSTNLNTSTITPTVTVSGNIVNVQYDYLSGSDVVSVSESVHSVLGGAGAQFYYIKPIDGTAIKNGSGQLTIEAHKVEGLVDTLLSSGTIQLFDPGDNIVNVANGYVTGSDGYTGILDSGDINGDIVITLKDGVAGAALDTITLVDVTDGLDSVSGYIEPENGLAWRREGTDGAWTPSQLTTDLDVTFVQGGSDVARQGYRLTLNSTDGIITGTVTTHPLSDLNTSRITITPTGSGSTTVSVKFDYTFSGDDASVSETVFSVTGGGTGLPGQFTSLDYDDLDTTQLAAGQSRYAMLTDVGDNTTGSQNNFHLTDGILINKKDIDGINYALLFSEVREGDRIVYKISNTRWFIFSVVTTFITIGTGVTEAYKFGVVLDDSLDPDPTANISTAAGTDVKFEIYRSQWDVDQTAVIDPDFDRTPIGASSIPMQFTDNGIAPDIIDFDHSFPGNSTFWYATQEMVANGSTDVSPVYTPATVVVESNGVNSSNSVKMKLGPVSATGASDYVQSIILTHLHRFRSNSGEFNIKIRARNQYTALSSVFIEIYGYSEARSTSIIDTASATLQIPASTTTWTEYSLKTFNGTSNPSAQYWEVTIRMVDIESIPYSSGNGNLYEMEFDSIFVDQIIKDFGETVIASKVESGLVPKALSSDASKYLQGDGTWSDPPGGSASDSFKTHTVTDTDSGYSWSATGSIIADSTTDILTWVSGNGINIDADSASDAIRITLGSHNHSAVDITSGILDVARGGTNIGSYAIGDILYASASGVLSKLAVGTDTHVLTLSSGLPVWVAPSSGYTHPNHSGDVTSVGDGAQTIVIDAVTYAKMQNVIADNRILGNIAGAGGIVAELTATQVRTLINVEDGSTADQTAGEIEAIVSHDNLVDFVSQEHIRWDLTGAEDVHADRFGGGANFADTVLDRPRFSDFATKHQAVAAIATTVISYSAGQSVALTMGAVNISTLTINSWPATGWRGDMEIEIIQNTTPRTINWSGANVEWVNGVPPDLSTASERYIIHLSTRDSATVVIGSYASDSSIGVVSVFGRSGAVIALQADYDSFFLTPAEGDAAYSLLGHIHDVFDRATSVLSGANVFSNIVVTDGIVTAIATRALTASDVGAATSGHSHVPADVTFAATDRFLGRDTTGGGAGEELTAAAARAILNVEDGSTADQTSIVGITGTKAQFDIAVTDGNIVYVGGAFHDGFSDFVDNEHIDWTAAAAGIIHIDNYVENVPTSLSTGTRTSIAYGITSDGGADDISLLEATTSLAGLLGSAKWDEIVANTLKITNANHTGDVTGATVLTIGALKISTGMVQIDAITYAKIQNIVDDDRILGNVAGAGGIVTELTATQVRTMINVADGATVDQTSIVGITGTKAQFDIAVTDGNIVYVGGAFHDGFSDFVSQEHIRWDLTGAEDVHADRFANAPVQSVFGRSSTVIAVIGDYAAIAEIFTVKQTFKASTTGSASIKIQEGVAPTTPTNGDMWVTAAGEFFARLNGVSVDLSLGAVDSVFGRSGAVVATIGDYAAIAEVYSVLQTFNAGISMADSLLDRARLGDFAIKHQVVAAIATTVISYSDGQSVLLTMSAVNIDTLTLNNWPATGWLGQYEIEIAQGATPRTITWPGVIEWVNGVPPDLSTANETYIIHLSTRDNGTGIIGSYAADSSAGVTSVFGRSGAVVALQADYDSFFLTPAEGDAAYSMLSHTHDRISVFDNRAAGDVTPDGLPDKTIYATFTDDIVGSVNVWDAVINVAGWATGYSAWQLMSNSGNDGDGTDSLYFRHGQTTTWGALRKIWDDSHFDIADYTPTSGLSITNWNTAYGWGDHASGGYADAGGAFHDSFSDFISQEHIRWDNTGAEDIHADRLSSGANMADSILDRPHISDFAIEDQVVTGIASTTINYSSGQSVQLNLSAANITTLTLSNWPATGRLGQIEIEVTQGSTPRTVAWDTALTGTIDWAGGTGPDLSTANGKFLVMLRSRDALTSIIGTFTENCS